MHDRIEERVLLEARLVADQVERDQSPARPGGFEAEAVRLAALVEARVTFIAADGRVLGDSWVTPSASARSKSTHTGRKSSKRAPTGWDTRAG